MTAPYYLTSFVDDIASIVEQVALRIHLATCEITGCKLALADAMRKNNLFGVLVSLKVSNNVFDFEWVSIMVEKTGYLTSLPQLRFDKLDLTLIVNYIALLVN